MLFLIYKDCYILQKKILQKIELKEKKVIKRSLNS